MTMRAAVILIFTALVIGHSPFSRAENPTSAPARMFNRPAGWKPVQNSDTLIFYDAPGRTGKQVCRIAVMAPTPLNGKFQKFFRDVQQPDPVVRESPVIESRHERGYEMLRQDRVVEDGGATIHRLYVMLRDEQNRVSLVLFTSDDETLYKRYVGAVDDLVASWDFAGSFPSKPGKGAK